MAMRICVYYLLSVLLVLPSFAFAEEQSKVFDSFAGEMLETIDPNVTVETKDTKPSTGGGQGSLFGGSDDEETKTENTESPTEDSEENDLFKDDDY